MRVVVDSNIYVEARFDSEEKSASTRIVHECAAGLLKLVYTADIKDEVVEVLKSFNPSDILFAQMYNGFAQGEKLDRVRKLMLCTDTSDNKFIDCAVTGNVPYVISRDAALLALDLVQSVHVCTPQDFYRIEQ